MTGDLGSDAGRDRPRPSFLPPVDGYPPPAGEPVPDAYAAPEPARGRGGALWILALIASASALLVSAFLPWAHAAVAVELFGRTLTRDLGSVAGIDADDMVLAVPVLAVIAIALAGWDLIGRDPRIGGLAAVPGTLALLVCGIFVLRLGDVRDDLPETGLDLGYQITVRYGWYLAVVASLFVVGFSLARPIGARAARSQTPGAHEYQYRPQEQYQPQYAYPEQPGDGAAWPDEDRAWGRRHDAPEELPGSEPGPRPAPEPEPKPDQS
ncbi:hypothetical protein SAMN05443665_100189 [Actinomadura meyerae]|uniref:Tryptophan-associated transmembrane protein (Trp_oprn_chp) n=1 Tax=Actinomadura meyerae TaxID=240840 RepID=A0A239BXK8_9ACTN|nr:hypothetical protein [Actinomadura meyerae]SNS12161.1 hypothetical protein SAMN05443665_100189 [Actinomadura meyerae]